jgi:hypothetical protein
MSPESIIDKLLITLPPPASGRGAVPERGRLVSSAPPVEDGTTHDEVARRRATRRRRIGPAGTAVRLVVGLGMLGSVVHGHLAGGFRPAPWLLGLVGFPLGVLALHSWGSRRAYTRIRATRPLAHVVNIAVLFALYLTPDYAPALSVTSDAALLFYGASMLLAAVRGYAGCEVLAFSNWVLARDDQVGCLVFAPVDRVERVGASERAVTGR